MSLRFLYFRDESGVLAVLRVPTKEAWDRIPFKELIKRAPGFVRGRGEGEKEKCSMLKTFMSLGRQKCYL